MEHFYFPLADDKKEWSDFTLVLPAVSVGNVGQLAVDLLVNSLHFSKVGTVMDDSITPVVGNDPYCESNKTCGLMTACDVYENSEKRIVAVQQRAPFVRGKRGEFVERVVRWIRSVRFRQVVVLGSTHAYQRTDQQLMGSQLRYLATKSVPDSEILEHLKKYETDADGSLHLPGGGLIKTILEKCESCDLKLICLTKFCMEGDNCDDSAQLVNLLAEWFNLGPVHWRMPPSWRYLFGNAVDKAMF